MSDSAGDFGGSRIECVKRPVKRILVVMVVSRLRRPHVFYFRPQRKASPFSFDREGGGTANAFRWVAPHLQREGIEAVNGRGTLSR